MAEATKKTIIPPSLRQRRLLIGTNVLLQALVVLSLLVMVNWLVSRHYYRFDWTKSGYYDLSEKTIQVLQALKEPVRCVVFLQPSGAREIEEKIFQDVRNLLQEFLFHGKDKLQIEYVDPYRDIARARQLAAEFKLDERDAGLVIFASGVRNKYVRPEDMVDIDYGNPMMGGGPPRIRSFKAEGAFLSAIQTVTEEKPPKVVFLTGHGERDPEDFDQRDGYSALSGYIKRDNITVEKWNLLEKQALPTDAGAIVVAGPRKMFSQVELKALDDFLKKQGRLFIMIDPRQSTGLDEFLLRWGVQVDDNLAIAKGGMLLGTELLIVDALGMEYASHPITAKMQDINTSFPYARSVRATESPQVTGADQPRVTELVKTPPAFWGETDLDNERSVFDAKKDIRGPLPLAVAVETSKPSGVNVDIEGMRMVVVGNSGFADNSTVGRGGGNLDFFMNSLNWLLKREQLVAVGPKFPQEFSLDMSVSQVRAVYALVIGGMPLAIAIVGLTVWLRRRR